MNQELKQPRLEVSIATQTISLWDGRTLVKSWPCSTSKYGIGFQEGSFRTPVGRFRIAEKHGDGALPTTIFKARQPVGVWHEGDEVDKDLVLGRILWLEGLEERNANTYQRYIYIHGTNGEGKIGQRASDGCIRLKNDDVVELYELAEVGMPVWVSE